MERDKEKTDDYTNYYGSIGDIRMSRVDDSLADLIAAIQESSEYRRYHDADDKLHEYPELLTAVHEFRRKNYQIQNSRDVDIFSQTDSLYQEITSMRKNPVVEEYLNAELALCRVVQNVNWKLIEGLDFSVGFMNERE